jgi:hypothetical protein
MNYNQRPDLGYFSQAYLNTKRAALDGESIAIQSRQANMVKLANKFVDAIKSSYNDNPRAFQGAGIGLGLGATAGALSGKGVSQRLRYALAGGAGGAVAGGAVGYGLDRSNVKLPSPSEPYDRSGSGKRVPAASDSPKKERSLKVEPYDRSASGAVIEGGHAVAARDKATAISTERGKGLQVAKSNRLAKSNQAKVNARDKVLAEGADIRGEVVETGPDGTQTRRPKTQKELAGPSFESQLSRKDREALAGYEKDKVRGDADKQKSLLARHNEKYNQYQQELKDREYAENERMSGVSKERQKVRREKAERDAEWRSNRDALTNAPVTSEGLRAGRKAFGDAPTMADRLYERISGMRESMAQGFE